MRISNEYKIFQDFIDTYLPVGFEGIRKENPMLQEICALMKKNRQFFYIADMLQLKVLYTCSTIKDILGIQPEDFEPGMEFESTHPDEMQRHAVSRSRMIKLCNELYATGEDYALMSTNLRFQHQDGHYINFLIQGYAFANRLPRPSIYCLFIKTDIDWFGPIKHGYNNYVGKDLSYFRIPDKELILTGCVFTDRELDIIHLIRKGMDSKTIGQKLFLSPHTIDTHRRNILKKTDKTNVSDLIIELQEKGFF